MVCSIVLATEQGLGYLAKDFYDNGVIDNVFVWEHTARKNHYEWYPNRFTNINQLFSCDTLLILETPHNWDIVKRMKELGKMVVIMPMYECTNPNFPVKPDKIICPSELDLKYYPNGELVTVPVSQTWRLRERARTFIHNAGNGGLGGRNGTSELLEAMKYVKSPIKLIIRTQELKLKSSDPRIEIRQGTFPKEELYNEGDVFIFPEKFNGLSLPIQEAFASGMPVMCGDRFPMNKWLPTEIMIPVSGYKKERISVEFDSAIITPQDIAKTIDRWYNCDIIRFSRLGKNWAKKNTWKNLKERYATLLSV